MSQEVIQVNPQRISEQVDVELGKDSPDYEVLQTAISSLEPLAQRGNDIALKILTDVVTTLTPGDSSKKIKLCAETAKLVTSLDEYAVHSEKIITSRGLHPEVRSNAIAGLALELSYSERTEEQIALAVKIVSGATTLGASLLAKMRVGVDGSNRDEKLLDEDLLPVLHSALDNRHPASSESSPSVVSAEIFASQASSPSVRSAFLTQVKEEKVAAKGIAVFVRALADLSSPETQSDPILNSLASQTLGELYNEIPREVPYFSDVRNQIAVVLGFSRT